MDPLRFAIAVVPLAAWLLVIGVINLRRRPFLTTGTSDLLALGLGLSGMVFVGPVALFRPEAATIQFGNYIWLFLMGFYWLWIALAAMTLRPRIVVYNMTPEQLRPLLAEAAAEIDASFRWAGETLVLPTLGVQLHIDGYRLLRNTSLVASGPKQNLRGWAMLSAQLRGRVQRAPATPLVPAVALVVLAIVLMGFCLLGLSADPQGVVDAAHSILAFDSGA